MRIIKQKVLKDFWESGCGDSEQALKSWYHICKQSTFNDPIDIKRIFASASFIGNNRVIFNIKGNKYRLVVHIRYDLQIMFIRFIGTHAEYSKINVNEV